jgi:hypothetical protein
MGKHITPNTAEEAFNRLARIKFEEAKSLIPQHAMHRFILFFEALRLRDYWALFQPTDEGTKKEQSPFKSYAEWGFNLTCATLFSSLEGTTGIPITHSSDSLRKHASSIIMTFGQHVLLKRLACMLKHEFMHAYKEDSGYTIRSANHTQSQFIDILEFSKLETLEQSLEVGSTTLNGWNIIDEKEIKEVWSKEGSYLLKPNREPLNHWVKDDIESKMLPLIHPWDSGYGIMMGYGAIEEVDNHFLAKAVHLVEEWRREAGLHPTTRLGNITGAELTVVATFIISLHLKHAEFAIIAAKHRPDISTPLSLTIWEPREELESAISVYSGWALKRIKRILDFLIFKAEDANFLPNHTGPLMPLLYELGNGYVVRPISSLSNNPFLVVSKVLQWRNPNIQNFILEPREDWMRSEVYALFSGTRYRCVEGNIKVRDGKTIATDIDGAIYDTTTGELALLQLKWQDYFTNDVKELMSKSKNYVEAMHSWTDKINKWLNKSNKDDISKSLRLKLNPAYSISKIYIFGISRTWTRMEGFGISLNDPILAHANWPTFVRIRNQIGPSKHVISDIHLALKKQENDTIQIQPIPHTLKVGECEITVEDLWLATTT